MSKNQGKHYFSIHDPFKGGSYDAISSFLSLWGVTSCLCIDKIPEFAKTKVSKPKRSSL